MQAVEETEVSCPYCGEPIVLLLDGSAGTQSYIEDCQVCCRPINVHVVPAGDEQLQIEVRHEDDA